MAIRIIRIWFATIVTVCVAILVLRAASQSIPPSPTFEVASIKLIKNWTPPSPVGISFLPGGALHAQGVTTRWLIESAYGVQPFKGYVTGGPEWLDADHYDLEAKADPNAVPAGASPTEIGEIHRVMLRALLVDRYKLEIRAEMKEVPVYILTLAKGGPKLQKAAPRDCSAENARCHHVSGGRASGLNGYASNMADLAETLSLFCDRPVVDSTGITGDFDIHITAWSDAMQTSAANEEQPPDSSVAPDIFGVLREQLGLKLEPQKTQATTYVVTSIQRPSEN